MILRLTDAAETDLAEIWAYIALEASEAIATRFVSAIKAEFDQLLAFPLSGPARKNLAPNLRVIVRVLHGARDVGAIADYGGFSA